MVRQKTVAVLGLTGALGHHVLNGLIDPRFRNHYQFPIRALARDPSKYENSDEVKYYSSSSNNPESLVEALKGVDTLIDLSGMYVDAKPVVEAAIKAGVRLFFPSDYGFDPRTVIVHYANTLKHKDSMVELARSKGMKTVVLCNGSFHEWTVDPVAYGLDFNSKTTWERIGSGNQTITCTSTKDVAMSLVSLAWRDPNSLSDYVRIHGDSISPNQVLEACQRCKNVKLTITEKTQEQAIKDAEFSDKQIANLGLPGFVAVLRAIICASDAMNFSKENDNEFVNPGLFEWSPYLPFLERALTEQ